MLKQLCTLSLITFTLLLLACNKENDELYYVPINFNSSVYDTNKTRVTEDSWDSGDKIGVFAIKSGTSLHKGAIIENYDNLLFSTLGSGVFTYENQPVYYPKDGSEIDIISYYPYLPNLISYTYPIDIVNQVDFMYSNNLKNASKYNKDNTLIFIRVLSKLSITIDSEASFTVEINGVKTKAAFSLANGQFTIDDISVGKLMLTPSNIDGSGLKEINCFLLPTTEKNCIEVFFKQNDSAVYKWTVPHALEKGKHYIYNLKLNNASNKVVSATSYIAYTS